MNDNYHLRISPDYDILYSDCENCCYPGYEDTIYNNNPELGPQFNFIVPGVGEWLRQYENATDFTNTTTDPSFDWATWHYEGLCFAKAIWQQLPRCYSLSYEPPFEDRSNIIQLVQIDERIDGLIEKLQKYAQPKNVPPSFINHLEFILERNSHSINLTFQIHRMKKNIQFPLTQLPHFLDWLKRIQTDKQPTNNFSLTGHNLLFMKQTIGSHLEMGRLHMKDSNNKNDLLSAYVNTKEFAEGLYQLITST